ncbi:hypothetical protein DDB_G0292098 [Dictyostelium discoideum AX4]|uniref:EGF-like domain-containing protein n=1 Tax=Dictyostelium discoideum TaxID=44689 RepID=Q54DP4_DICDI|nr:hypothetical protein DDB_G0292098 [Dictyostelium discoideum AX4]EAL61405.1 hypothetical protein DDB_G0292098 [Dictyostelium discoideum AX4]|eukprot:XP_629828.1 hypothetical protein DDB_G0292098 [Dictyostelium discoideum AX4]
MKYYYILIVFLYLIFSINISFSIDVISSQVQCLNNIAINTGDVTLNPTNGAELKTIFCGLGSNLCHDNGSVSQISITQVTQYSLSSADILCFPNLVYFKGKKLTSISPSFFITFNPSITDMDIYASNLVQLDFPINPLRQLLFGGVSLIKMTSLNNVKSFGAYDDSDITIDTSGDTSNSVLWNFGCYTNNIPNFSVGLPLLTSLSFGIGSAFVESSLDNVISYDGKIKSLAFSGAGKEIPFPMKLSELQNCKITTLNFQYGVNLKTSNYIDLSNIPFLNTFYILEAGPNFNINGNFPFKALPTTVTDLEINNGNIPNFPDLNIFNSTSYVMLQNLKMTGSLPVNPLKNTNTINLSQNLINGTIDDSWCNIFLTINNNQLTGSIPDCNYCYLKDSSVYLRFAGNNFNNYLPGTATCDHSKIIASFDKNSKGLILHGKNLGTLPTNIKSKPSCTFTYDWKTLNYTASCNDDPDKVELYFVPPNVNFTLSTGKLAPIITSMVQDNDTFTIEGSYLSYIGSEVKVTIGDTPIQCMVIDDDPMNTSFYQAKCKINYPIVEYGEKLVSVSVYNKVGTIKINLKHTPVPCPIEDCNGNGICNDHIGVCECNEKWATVGSSICTVANHYVSSYVPLVDDETVISFYGWFGLSYNNLSITIGEQNCGNNIFINQTFFNCTLLPSSSPSLLDKAFTQQLLNVTQNGISWSSLIYPYVNPILSCPNNCGNNATNGRCDTKTGNCWCNTGFTGLDCSPIPSTKSDIPTSNTNVDNVGVVGISNEQSQFSISIDSILEIDFYGNPVAGKSKILSKNWILSQSKDNQGITIFKQTFDTAIMELKIQEVQQTTLFTFANNQFTVQSGGIKISMSISNWNFTNTLNTLDIKLSSNSTINPKATTENKCNDDDLFNVESESNNKFISSLNYIKISKQGKQLYGRFQDKFLSDGRPTMLTTKLLSFDNEKVIMVISLPHCENKCELDPDFSVLVSPNFKSSDSCISNNQNGGKNKPWLIPVAVVIPIVGVCLIAVIVIIIIKKNSIAIKIGLNSISMKRR